MPYQKTIIGFLLVMSVFFLCPYIVLARQDLDEGINALTEQINKYMVEQKKTKIAIIPFPDIQKQKVNVFGSFIAEELTTNLFTTGKFKIVERSLLKQVLDELKLGQTGIVDANSAKELGKLTGVDAIIAGTITDLGSTIAINCRLIETQSGEVFAAAKTRILKNKDLEKMLGEGSEDVNSKRSNSKPAIEAKAPEVAQNKRASVNDYEFEITKSNRNGERIQLDFIVTYKGDRERVEIWLSHDRTRLTDKNGNVYLPIKMEFSNRTTDDSNLKGDIVKDIPMRGKLTFQVDGEDNSFALLEISMFSGIGRSFTALIRNISIN